MARQMHPHSFTSLISRAAFSLALSAVNLARAEVPRPQIPKGNFSIIDYGAIADGKTDNTTAIARTIGACENAGGGTVNIPNGQFFTTQIKLGSNLNLHLDAGATLLMSNHFDDYPKDARGGYENEIVADHCHDLAVTGDGTIDGQGDPWWTQFRKTKNNPLPDSGKMGRRPYLVSLNDCTRVLVQGVTLTNSPSFHLVPDRCRDVTIDHVQFRAPSNSPNTDALDPSGWNYLIANCTFDVGDDCIAFKAGGKPDGDHLSCEDFLVTDCTMKHGHGLSIGSQTSGGLRRLTVRNCTFDGTETGIRLKSNRQVGGLVEDCTYQNLTMTDVKTPIYITSYYPERDTPRNPTDDLAKPITQTTPIWRHIQISHITASGGKTAGKIIGLAEMPIANLTFTDVKLTAERGMTLWNAKDIRFVDCDIKAAKGEPLEQQQTTNITGLLKK